MSTAEVKPEQIPGVLQSLLTSALSSYLRLLHVVTHDPSETENALISLRTQMYNMHSLVAGLREAEARADLAAHLEAVNAEKKALLAEMESVKSSSLHPALSHLSARLSAALDEIQAHATPSLNALSARSARSAAMDVAPPNPPPTNVCGDGSTVQVPSSCPHSSQSVYLVSPALLSSLPPPP